jgi:hypothetical protein
VVPKLLLNHAQKGTVNTEMSAATARAGREEAKFYTWLFPGAPVEIRLYLDVVKRLQEKLKRSSDAGSSFSRGLLLGRVDTPGLPEITDFRPLSTSHPGELEAALANVKQSADGLVLLGYYRTQEEEGLSLSPSDVSLAQAFFSDPNCVFLLIRPSDTNPATAGFFYWDRGKLNGGFYDFCFLEFSFDATLLDQAKPLGKDPEVAVSQAAAKPPAPRPEFLSASSPRPSTQAEGAEVRPRQQPLPTPIEPPASVAENTSVSRPKRYFRSVIWPGVALLTVAVGLCGWGIYASLKQSATVQSGGLPLSLTVKRQDTSLVVSWNQNAQLVASADKGRLTIHDRTVRQFPLDKNFLRSGSIVYVPISDEVRIQLELTQPDQKVVSEFIVFELPAPPSPVQSRPAGNSLPVVSSK